VIGIARNTHGGIMRSNLAGGSVVRVVSNLVGKEARIKRPTGYVTSIPHTTQQFIDKELL
jgi:hypothetical protein